MCDATYGRTEPREGDLDRDEYARQREAHDSHHRGKSGCGCVSRDEERWFLRDDIEERLRHRQRGQREDVAGLSDRPAGDALEHTLNRAPRVEGTTPLPGDVGRDTYRGPRGDHQEYTCCEDQPDDNGRAD